MGKGMMSFRQFWRLGQEAIKGTRKQRRTKARQYYRAYLKIQGEKSTETKKGDMDE